VFSLLLFSSLLSRVNAYFVSKQGLLCHVLTDVKRIELKCSYLHLDNIKKHSILGFHVEPTNRWKSIVKFNTFSLREIPSTWNVEINRCNVYSHFKSKIILVIFPWFSETWLRYLAFFLDLIFVQMSRLLNPPEQSEGWV